MREYLISAARHIAGAAVGGLVSLLTSQGLIEAIDPQTLAGIEAGIQAFVVGAGLVGYALAEKGLKPLVRRIFGSEGVA